MNLSFAKYGFYCEIKKEKINIISIEKPCVLTDLLSNLWNQFIGETGEVIISEQEREIQVNKSVDLIMNPFSVDCNDRRIINNLLKEVQSIAFEKYYEKCESVNREILLLLDEMLSGMPYDLDHILELDIIGLLKLYNLSVINDADSFLEKLINYMKVMHRVCQNEIFIFYGLRQFFDDKELEGLYQFIEYEHLICVIIEGQFLGKRNGLEECLIVDRDLCIINV